jgi:hypothetical protein
MLTPPRAARICRIDHERELNKRRSVETSRACGLRTRGGDAIPDGGIPKGATAGTSSGTFTPGSAFGQRFQKETLAWDRACSLSPLFSSDGSAGQQPLP